MKILVTGAAGFVGSNLTEYLLNQGNEVFGIDNFITGSTKNVEGLSRDPKFTFFEADIVDSAQIEKLISPIPFDEIYHLACPTGVPNLVTLAEEMLSTNSIGTRNILEVAKRARAKFLLTSSSEIYGDPEIFPQAESYTGNVDPTGVRSPYEEGKRFAEGLVAMYSRKYGVEANIVRVFNTYGPGMSDKDTRVIPNFLQRLKDGEPLRVHGDGSQRRTFCHVDDLVAGLVLVAKRGAKGAVYNIGGESEISILDLANLIIGIFGGTGKIVFEERALHDHQARLPDLSKIAALGWQPKINLEKGLTLTLASYESAKI